MRVDTKVEERMNSYRDNGCNWVDYVYVVLIKGEEMRIRRVEID